NKHAQTINLSFGQAIKFKELNTLSDDQVVNYLRLNTYLLNRETQSVKPSSSSELLSPIAAGLPVGELLEELNNLPQESKLLTNGEF
ncbi:TPA: hypothetical protein PZ808_003155, partial [Staphylococcus aureus]|nr:hypothetical protein [Staphylococcus aureus]